MPGKINISAEEFGLRIQSKVEARYEALVQLLCYVGEQCIREARENGSYKDQTGNLRSSIGYAVVKNGKVVRKGYGGKVKDGYGGESEGKAYLRNMAKEAASRKGLVLIVTAGMNYAEYVEARGYNVLTSAELKAEYLVRTMLTKLGFEFK